MPYHINDKGEPGQCRARKACPFSPAEDHFADASEARAMYERAMEIATTLKSGDWCEAPSLSEAKQLAQLVSQAGRHAIVIHDTDTYADEDTMPNHDDFVDEEAYNEAMEDWINDFYDDRVAFTEPYHTYNVHVYDSWAELAADDERGWNRGFHHFNFDPDGVKRGKELTDSTDFESSNYRKVDVSGYYYAPITASEA